jgi:TPR repeat protein
VRQLKAENTGLTVRAAALRQDIGERSKREVFEQCDRLAGDPFDEAHTLAKRSTRHWDELKVSPHAAVKACEEALALSSDIRFRYQLGRGRLAAKDKKAIDELEKARQQGYVASMTLLGWTYRDGFLGEKDMKKAVQYYTQAIERGDAAAMVQLGLMYRKDDYGMEDQDEALKLYSEAARKKFPSALLALGEFYMTGDAGQRDCGQAISLLGEAAKLGNKRAAEHLTAIATKKGCR